MILQFYLKSSFTIVCNSNNDNKKRNMLLVRIRIFLLFMINFYFKKINNKFMLPLTESHYMPVIFGSLFEMVFPVFVKNIK